MIVLEEPWTLPRHQAVVSDLVFGKRLPGAVYLLDGPGFPIPGELATVLGKLREKLVIGPEGNVLKLATDRLRISFLSYPEFFQDPHPALRQAVTVDLAAGTVRRTDYGGRPNPPILHRKEAFLPPGHVEISRFSALTQAEEAHGLYDNTSVIGFRANWERLLASKALVYDDHRLVQISTPDGLRRSHAVAGRKIDMNPA